MHHINQCSTAWMQLWMESTIGKKQINKWMWNEICWKKIQLSNYTSLKPAPWEKKPPGRECTGFIIVILKKLKLRLFFSAAAVGVCGYLTCCHCFQSWGWDTILFCYSVFQVLVAGLEPYQMSDRVWLLFTGSDSHYLKLCSFNFRSSVQDKAQVHIIKSVGAKCCAMGLQVNVQLLCHGVSAMVH